MKIDSQVQISSTRLYPSSSAVSVFALKVQNNNLKSLEPSPNIFFRCWVLYEINKSPEVLKRVREEHDEVLGSDAKLAAQVLSLEPHKLNSLRYTTAAIKESLRLHPLGSTHRRGSRGFNFVCEGTTYPTEDSVIWTSPTAVHLRSDLWPRVMEFLPERFLVAEGHPLHPVKNAWRPFELGNTRCIGEELVMVEMKLVLALTMRELDFKFDWEGWNTLQYVFLISPSML